MSDEHVQQSRDFVGAIDRSMLGSLAVDSELLVLEDATLRVKFITPRTIWQMVGTMEDVHAHAELLFWLNRVADMTPEDADTLAYYMTELDGVDERSLPGVAEWLGRLAVVEAHPEMLRYFEVGIWDVDAISLLMADGVDPALAAEVSAGRSVL